MPVPPSARGVEDLAGVRPFRAGDPASAVHWRASARRGPLSAPAGPSLVPSLVVVEREAEVRGLLVLLLDPVPGLGEEGFEALLASASALVLAERGAGRRVAVLDAGGRAAEGLAALDVLAAAERGAVARPELAVRAAGRDGRVLVGDGQRWRYLS
nr:DUF58 domain-containing protein [Kineococcus aurantiacus]